MDLGIWHHEARQPELVCSYSRQDISPVLKALGISSERNLKGPGKSSRFSYYGKLVNRNPRTLALQQYPVLGSDADGNMLELLEGTGQRRKDAHGRDRKHWDAVLALNWTHGREQVLLISQEEATGPAGAEARKCRAGR